jgi:UDP-3-O-[3-hydroxymyristoyl] glucosamine N-acyltransferase
MLKLENILGSIDYLELVGLKTRFIARPVQLGASDIDEHCIYWISDKKLELQETITVGTVICSRSLTHYHPDCTYIVVDNPRLAFKEVISTHFDVRPNPFISHLAFIHPTATIGKEVTIDHFAVIEEGCVIGDNCVIGSHTILKRNTILGKAVKLGSNNTIGGVGFGYEKDLEGNYDLLPHLGNVEIEDFVEVGNNTCIDRAVMGSTKLGRNVKVDNLVHIAHGVQIGENSLIIANAMIGGSTIIGKNVWFAPSASVLNKKTIADDAVIGLAAVVVKDVKQGEIIIGNPGKPLIK